MLSGQELLIVHKELLVHLFARTQTDFFDLDIFSRLKTAQRNKVDGKVVDLDRLTHVQYKNLAAMRQSAGSNDKLASLRDGHEVTRDVLVRNGDRAALAKLTLKQRDNRSMTTQNIAKANSRKNGLAVGRIILNDHLVHTLGGAHYICRINGLIGRNLHIVAALVLVGKAYDIERAKDVILDCLAGVVFHKRNVFVGCSVENNLRMVLLKDLGNCWEMRNRADIDLNISALIMSGLDDVVIQLVGSVLINVEQHDLRSFAGSS